MFDGSRAILDVGDASSVRKFAGPGAASAGYEYVLSEGARSAIPLSASRSR